MTRPISFHEDLAQLPTHAFSHRSVTWWGVVGFMVIEAIGFAMLFAAYFFIMSHEQSWPPEPWRPPDLIAGTLFTILILLSEVPNTMTKKAALRHDVDKVRVLLPIVVLVGLLLLIVRAFEFGALNVLWSDNAYGSIIWAILLVHTIHLLTDCIDTAVLAVLMQTPLGREGRRFEDTDENALYWRFVWISWLPIYFLIYWLPRI